MALNTYAFVHAWDTDARAKTIIDTVKQMFTDLGWTQTSDTGQIDTSATRTVTDLATTSASTTITSATAAFTNADIFRSITLGSNVYYITAINSATSVTVNASTGLTTASGQTATIAFAKPYVVGILLGYHVFKSGDATLSATNQVYVKVLYYSSGSLGVPRILFEVGNGTNGAGIITGNHTPQIATTNLPQTLTNAVSQQGFAVAGYVLDTSVKTSYAMGDGGRIQIIWAADTIQNYSSAMFSISRLCTAGGVYLDTGVFVMCLYRENSGGNVLNKQQVIGKAGGAIGQGKFLNAISSPFVDSTTTNATNSTPDTIGLHPIATWSSGFCCDIAFGHVNEANPMAGVVQNVFGGNKRYVSPPQTGFNYTYNGHVNNFSPAIYFRGE